LRWQAATLPLLTGLPTRLIPGNSLASEGVLLLIKCLDVHQQGEQMTVQASYVRTLFANLENGRTDAFFDHVAEDVNWTVMGTHPLAGTYHTKADFLAHTFARLNKLLKEGVVLRVTNLLVDGDTAAVEMESLSTALNGKPFDNRYCWVTRFSNGTIVEVRAYLDSALVKQLIDENERPPSM
jgi:ketosteroid isomerase-like protein